MSEINTKTNQTEATVEKLVYGGDALARVDGQVLLTPFALPGEEISVQVAPGKGKTLRGSQPRILRPSSHRIEPDCEYFGRCGGCHYQHAAYDYQVDQKISILKETLYRLGRISFDGEIGALRGEPWAYRNRIQLHFDGKRMGFREAESHRLCPIGHCPISSPKLNSVIGSLRRALGRPEWPAFLRQMEVFTNERDVQLNVLESDQPVASRFFTWLSELLPGLAPGPIEYDAAGTQLRISSGTFFQVNRFLIEPLLTEVTGSYEGESALDLYAGAGLFSIPLASRFQSVTAVERGTSAYRDLQQNAGELPLTIVKASTDAYLRELIGRPDLIVADPPRAGLTAAVTAELIRIGAPKLVIVSCDPATLARDLSPLLRDYTIGRMTLVDLFPQTYHFETVVHLERRSAADSGDC